METPDDFNYTPYFDVRVSTDFIKQASLNLIKIRERQEALRRRYEGIDLKIEVLLDEIRRIKEEWEVV